MPKSSLIKTTIVTGGLGFIGSHLVRKLLSIGKGVIVFDNLSNHLEDSLTEFSKNKNFRLIQHDVSNPFPQIDFAIDKVFHLAALVSVPDSFQNPLRTHQVNETGLINVLDFCRKQKVKKLVYASSCAVYGSSENVPLKENERVVPESPYGLTKLNNEYYARFHHQAYGTSSIGLRFFNVYGPGQKPDSAYAGVISIFMDRAMNNKAVTIYGDGSQVRDFVYVGDIVDALIAASESGVELDVFNIGRGIETSVSDLFNTISKITGYNQTANYAPPRMGDVMISCSDPSKISEQIGYSAKWSLEDGLSELYKSISK
ncbi:MAG: nucleoside-diphosphate-sugar epimerase [Cryomorphaceae bacterium]|jgi:nucleoside-diphosphate-sugar epimerase